MYFAPPCIGTPGSLRMGFSLFLRHYFLLLSVYGAALLEHCLMEEGFPGNVKIGAGFDLEQGLVSII